MGHSLDLEHSTAELSTRGKLSALQRQESCLFNLSIGQSALVIGLEPRPPSTALHSSSTWLIMINQSISLFVFF